MKSFFFDRFVMRRNYRELLISLEKGDQQLKDFVKHSGMAYQHLCSVMQEAQKEDIVSVDKKSNSLCFNLTEKGKVVVELCVGLKMCIEDWDEDKTVDALNKLSFIKKPEKINPVPKKNINTVSENVVVQPAKLTNQVVTDPEKTDKENKRGDNDGTEKTEEVSTGTTTTN